MIGTMSIQAHKLVREYEIKVIKNHKWLIIHQNFLASDQLFRSIYIPAIEKLSITVKKIEFFYENEYFKVTKTDSAFFDYFESMLKNSLN